MTTRRLPSTVVALGLVSLLTDVSSEMIYPLLPVFMSGVLGASALSIGAMEGGAEALASLLKYGSGWWSDRLPRRKPLVVGGYLISSVLRPLVGMAQGVWAVVLIRMGDRVGKGVRTAPRDAMIADAVAPDARGRAFGFHRAADHLGAVAGPLVAWALLEWGGWGLRAVFLASAIPALVSVVVLVVFVRERGRASGRDGARVVGGGLTVDAEREDGGGKGMVRAGAGATATMSSGGPPALPSAFLRYLLVVLLFTLGNATDAYLLLRARDVGVAPSSLPLLWAVLHLVKAVASTPAGALSDRVGRRGVIAAGWLVYALVYLGFALAEGAAWAWVLFACYGAFFGLTEGVERALVADLVPPAARGRAFGWFHLTVGVGALPAALLFGTIWERAGATSAFLTGSALAATAALLLTVSGARPGASSAAGSTAGSTAGSAAGSTADSTAGSAAGSPAGA
jgi:MFS family permease